MEIINTEFDDCYIIKSDYFNDERGSFTPYFINNEIKFNIVQANRSFNKKGVVRGLHFQKEPYSQAKIVECLKGKILDVIVDLRKSSKTYGKYIKILLSNENHLQVYIPKGMAHGFIALEDDSIFQYFVDNLYNQSMEDGIIYNDKDLNIDWELEKYDIIKPIISIKDMNNKSLKEYEEHL